MAFSLVGTTITQTGTDADSSGLSGITGVTTIELPSSGITSSQDRTIYVLPDEVQVVVGGTWTIDQQIEQVVCDGPPDGQTAIFWTVISGGTLNNGTLITADAARGSAATNVDSLVFTEQFSGNSHFTNRADIRVNSNGTYNNFAGVVSTMGITYENGSSGTFRGSFTCQRTISNFCPLVVQDASIIVDCQIIGNRAQFSPGADLTTVPQVEILASTSGINNRFTPDGTTISASGFFTVGCSVDIQTHNLGESRHLLENVPIIDGTPFDYEVSSQFSTTALHRIETRKPDVEVTVTDANGDAVENALVYFRDYINGTGESVRRDTTYFTFDSGAFNQAYTEDRVYAGFTDSSGQISFDMLTRVSTSNTNTDIRAWNYRSKDGDASDVFEMFIHKSGFVRVNRDITIAGAGATLEIPITIVTDNSVTETEAELIADTVIADADGLYSAAWIYSHFGATWGTRFTATAGTGALINTDTDFNNIPHDHAEALLPPFTGSMTMDFGNENIDFITDGTLGSPYTEDAGRDVIFAVTADAAWNLSGRTIITLGQFDVDDIPLENGGLDVTLLVTSATYIAIPDDTDVDFSLKDIDVNGQDVDVITTGTGIVYFVCNNVTGGIDFTRTGNGTVRVLNAPTGSTFGTGTEDFSPDALNNRLVIDLSALAVGDAYSVYEGADSTTSIDSGIITSSTDDITYSDDSSDASTNGFTHRPNLTTNTYVVAYVNGTKRCTFKGITPTDNTSVSSILTETIIPTEFPIAFEVASATLGSRTATVGTDVSGLTSVAIVGNLLSGSGDDRATDAQSSALMAQARGSVNYVNSMRTRLNTNGTDVPTNGSIVTFDIMRPVPNGADLRDGTYQLNDSTAGIQMLSGWYNTNDDETFTTGTLTANELAAVNAVIDSNGIPQVVSQVRQLVSTDEIGGVVGGVIGDDLDDRGLSGDNIRDTFNDMGRPGLALIAGTRNVDRR